MPERREISFTPKQLEELASGKFEVGKVLGWNSNGNMVIEPTNMPGVKVTVDQKLGWNSSNNLVVTPKEVRLTDPK